MRVKIAEIELEKWKRHCSHEMSTSEFLSLLHVDWPAGSNETGTVLTNQVPRARIVMTLYRQEDNDVYHILRGLSMDSKVRTRYINGAIYFRDIMNTSCAISLVAQDALGRIFASMHF